MIIDCHGHYTTAPGALQKFRDAQIAGLKEGVDLSIDAQAPISDDQIRESLENAQLKLQRARGTDLTIFSYNGYQWRSVSGGEVQFPPEGSGFRLQPMNPSSLTQRSSSAALLTGTIPGDCGS